MCSTATLILNSSMSHDKHLTKKIISKLDSGPTTCLFLSLLSNTIKQNLNHSENFDTLIEVFPFTNSLLSSSQKLISLIESFNQLPSQSKKNAILPSLSSWIFYSNNIEGVGLPSSEDTERCIRRGARKNDSTKEYDVLLTFQLLQKMYLPSTKDSTLSARMFTLEQLQQWHRDLFTTEDGKSILLDGSDGGDGGELGKFRQGSAYTLPLDNNSQPHIYPHHSILNMAVKEFCTFTSMLATRIDLRFVSPLYAMAYTISLAAFCQFHFVDIHPFDDGNGRMCRLISKHILDHICPLPIPMFIHRERYIDTLVEGRKDHISHAPKRLAELILESGIQYYMSLLETHAQCPFLYLVSGKTREDLYESMKREEIQKESLREHILRHFDAMDSDSEKDIEEDRIKIRIKKYPSILWDEI